MKKERFDFLADNYLYKNKEQDAIRIITNLVNRLIESLYCPCSAKDRSCFMVDADRIRIYSIDENEPVNWGDLKVCDVVKEKERDCYIVTIEEASPDECSTFCNYIQRHMHAWGWGVTVKTEW